jgi:hypothetical protein
MAKHLEALFPGLRGSGYRVTSPIDEVYNCIAWAAGDVRKWWWPDPHRRRYWPAGVYRVETLGAFEDAFASLGYVTCVGDVPESGFEKIALFAGSDGIPLHAARQLLNGRWTSKLGELEDIEHALHDLAGEEYGSVVLIMKRASSSGA